MRRKEKEIKDPKIIQELLNTATVCRVAFKGDEFPYIVPMNYGQKDGALYFHCAKEGKKLDLLKLNNKVAFEITHSSRLEHKEESCSWTTAYRSLMGNGEIEILTNADDKVNGLDILMEQHGNMNNSYPPKLLERIVILKLTILQITGKQHGNF